jgi:Na+-translocating ferredoxin:NAD+ oxidoreductase subunit C
MITLHRFPGGIHPEQHKAESTSRPIHAPFIPNRLVIPMRQHIGQPAKPIVKVGDTVLKGQMIGQAEGYFSAAVHASSSGVVTGIGLHPVPHPSGLPDLCMTIETDGLDQWAERRPLDWQNLDPGAVRGYVRDLGIAGLGGAVFPTSIKLDPKVGQPIQTLIINGGECEPWITCDDLLMRERAAEILHGARIMQHLLGAQTVIAGIEDNKPEAIAAMRAAADRLGWPIEIAAMPTCYPGGGGKQITQTLTGLETPSGKLSNDIGVQVFNVGTAYALARALMHGEPLISRIVTVTGHVLGAQNYEVLIGTPIGELVTHAGEREGTTGMVMGGPMMGFDVPSPAAPVVKATNCILVKSAELFPPRPRELPCIRCTQCAVACPAGLQPQELYWFARAKNFGKAQEYHLFDCIECGCCSYVCPSHIPLVDYYRFAKSEIWAREKERQAADIARERHEFHLFRLEREKKEKAERLAAKAQTKKAEAPAIAPDAEDAKKKLIADALARAQAKKAAVAPRNVDNLTPEQRAEIAEIEARRAKIREMAKNPVEPEQH